MDKNIMKLQCIKGGSSFPVSASLEHVWAHTGKNRQTDRDSTCRWGRSICDRTASQNALWHVCIIPYSVHLEGWRGLTHHQHSPTENIYVTTSHNYDYFLTNITRRLIFFNPSLNLFQTVPAPQLSKTSSVFIKLIAGRYLQKSVNQKNEAAIY